MSGELGDMVLSGGALSESGTGGATPSTVDDSSDVWVILFTDNGFGVRRTPGSTSYAVTWQGSGIPTPAHEYEAEIVGLGPNAPQFTNPGRITVWANTGDTDHPLYSGDGGATWTLGTLLRPTGFGRPLVAAKNGVYNTLMDEAGHVYISAVSTTAPNHVWLFQAPDYRVQIWAAKFDATALFGVSGPILDSTYIADGYLWYLDYTTRILHRCTVEGAGYDSWSITLPGGLANIDSYVLSGWPRTRRLLAWAWDTTKRLLSIDVRDPDNPGFTWSADQPFGVNQRASDVLPISNQIIIANTYSQNIPNPGDYGLSGAIWRSSDGGVTWANMVPDTTRLGQAQTQLGVGSDNEISAIAVDPKDPANVWVALSPPYVYYSPDGGLTWGYTTIDMTIFDSLLGASGVRPQEWTGLCAARAAVAARQRPHAVLVG